MEEGIVQVDKVKAFCVDKIEWVKNNERLKEVVFTLITIYLLLKTCTNVVYGTSAPYQVYRDYYNYRAIAFFLVLILLLRKISFKSWSMIFLAVGYTVAALKHFSVAGYEISYYNAMRSKWMATGLFLLVLADVIRSGNRTKWKKSAKIVVPVLLLAVGCALAFCYQSCVILIMPVLALYLTPISKRRWVWLADRFTVSYYLAVVWLMTKSLRIVPYSEGLLGGKYCGIFTNAGPVGIVCAGACVCVLYWFYRAFRKEEHMLAKKIIAVLLMIFPLWTTFITGSRTAEMGLVGLFILAFIFWPRQKKENQWKRRCVVMLVELVLIGGFGLAALYMLGKADYSVIEEFPIETVRSRLILWRSAVSRALNNPAAENLKEGSLLNMIDGFSNYRISIPLKAISTLTPFGQYSYAVELGGMTYVHPHNNYVAWLMVYGWVGGIGVILGYFTAFVNLARRSLKKDDACVFGFLWLAYMTFVMFTEFIPWYFLVAAVMAMVPYPLLIEQEEE